MGPEQVEPIRDYEWEVGKGKMVCFFTYGGHQFRLSLDMRKGKRQVWRWQRDANYGNPATSRGKVARHNVESVAKLGAILGIPGAALREMMREFEELQALRNLADLGESDVRD